MPAITDYMVISLYATNQDIFILHSLVYSYSTFKKRGKWEEESYFVHL